MHELAIIKKIVEAADTAAKENGVAHVQVLRMRVGQMAAVHAAQLQVLFKTSAKGSRLENASLEIEEVNVRLKCTKCDSVFNDQRFDDHDFAHTIAHAQQTYTPPACPHCKAENADIINGQEMELLGIQGI